MYEFTYHWLHIPTGKTGVTTQEFFDRDDLLVKLNRWNGQLPGTWQYWD